MRLQMSVENTVHLIAFFFSNNKRLSVASVHRILVNVKDISLRAVCVCVQMCAWMSSGVIFVKILEHNQELVIQPFHGYLLCSIRFLACEMALWEWKMCPLPLTLVLGLTSKESE